MTAYSALQLGRNPMPVLVVGADGVIGASLVRSLKEVGVSVVGTTRRKADSTAERIFVDLGSDAWFDSLPLCRAAVFCAAATSTELCRKDPVGTRLINVTNTLRLARSLVSTGAHVIFLSTNTVFDGSRPWVRATASTNPTTEYGRQKAEAESRLLALDGLISIVRFSKVIFPEMPLLNLWVNDLYAGRVIHPYSDYRLSPVPVSFAVELLLRVIGTGATGVIQASGSSDITYEELALYLAKRFRLSKKLIEPVSCAAYDVERAPANTTLEPTQFCDLGLSIMPQTFSAVEATIATIRPTHCTSTTRNNL